MWRAALIGVAIPCAVALVGGAQSQPPLAGSPTSSGTGGRTPLEAIVASPHPSESVFLPSLTPTPTPRPTTRLGDATSYFKPTPKPKPPAKSVTGVATYYDYNRAQAAAAAKLRNWLGPEWRGMQVNVCGPVGCKTVTLTDFESSKIPGRLIDLDQGTFPWVCGPLYLGRCIVRVSKA